MTDYVGQWFRALRKINEPADILFRIEQNGKSEFVEYPHEQGDGSAALFTFAERYGWKIKNHIKSSRPGISTLKYVLTTLLFLFWTRKRRQQLWPFTLQKCTNPQTRQSEYVFSTEQTKHLSQAASMMNVSLNTLLFFQLNHAISRHIEFKNKKRCWWIPVNMRPDLGLDPNDPLLKANYVSNFTVNFTPEQSLTEFQALLSASLKSQKHWGTWWWQHLGRFLPEVFLSKIIAHDIKNNFCVGTFSNLGEWSCTESTSNMTFYVNPVLSHPIAAGALIWNGRLNLSIRLYPTFKYNPENIMTSWAHLLSGF